MDKALQLLSLCRRAGRLQLGFDAAKQAVRRGEAVLVLCSGELSERTQWGVEQFCAGSAAELRRVSYPLDTLARYVGKRVGIIAVNDANFAKAICAELQ